ncbi:hypothetical protein WBP07_20865 (plasmid) [Novosphingobium sp. BL-8A]|uniref:hypothetical protein n=1 Tax=Novosphingobium sp. BL-8A TaxID=3127639 RepID=UPI00375736FC
MRKPFLDPLPIALDICDSIVRNTKSVTVQEAFDKQTMLFAIPAAIVAAHIENNRTVQSLFGSYGLAAQSEFIPASTGSQGYAKKGSLVRGERLSATDMKSVGTGPFCTARNRQGAAVFHSTGTAVLRYHGRLRHFKDTYLGEERIYTNDGRKPLILEFVRTRHLHDGYHSTTYAGYMNLYDGKWQTVAVTILCEG